MKFVLADDEPPWDEDDLWAERTVAELRVYLWAHSTNNSPVICQGCYGKVKQYKRRIYKGYVQALVYLYQHYPEYAHLPSGDPTKGDASKMVHWELIEEERIRRLDGGRAGWWRITPKGISFLNKGIRVPKIAVLFQDRLLRFEGPLVDVDDCYETFDLQEMMSR